MKRNWLKKSWKMGEWEIHPSYKIVPEEKQSFLVECRNKFFNFYSNANRREDIESEAKMRIAQ